MRSMKESFVFAETISRKSDEYTSSMKVSLKNHEKTCGTSVKNQPPPLVVATTEFEKNLKQED